MKKYSQQNTCHRVSLKSLTTTIGDGGRKTESYTPIATIWAAIEPAHHAPQFRGGKTVFPVSHEITTRYSQSYEAARQIIFGTRVFQVRSKINVGEKKQYLVFRCEELSNN